MATPTFKSSMNQLTDNQYWFIERPAFILASALMEIYYLFKFIPATEVAVPMVLRLRVDDSCRNLFIHQRQG